jgi:hypothetical protein
VTRIAKSPSDFSNVCFVVEIKTERLENCFAVSLCMKVFASCIVEGHPQSIN